MLSEPVALHDIRDAEAFVQATINRARVLVAPDQREDLVAEGIAILCRLARDFKPHIDGHEHAGRFSGYAAMYLPRKLGDAWHRMHAHHQHTVDPGSGKRVWTYREKDVSLEALTAGEDDRHTILADESVHRNDWAKRAHKALWDRWTQKIEVIVLTGELFREGATIADVSANLGIDPEQVREAIEELRIVYDRLEEEAA